MENNRGEIVVYQPDEITRLEVRVNDDTVWLTQGQMSDLFGRDRTVITKHIRNIFSEQELDEKSNVHFLHFANSDKPVMFYSLDIILSVGYRTNSSKAILFRRWANSVLKEYLIKGYALNQKRLDELNTVIDIISRSSVPEISGVASVLDFFTKGLNILDVNCNL